MAETNAGEVAAAYLSTGNHQRAAEVLRQALADSPDDAGLLANYAQACLGMDDYLGAASAAYAVLSAKPDDEHAMRLYALALEGLHRGPEALWVAWRNVTEHPDAHLAHYAYASLLRSAGHPREAFAAVNEALRLNPAWPNALVLRGDLYRSLFNAPAAEADYRRALQIDPDNATAVHNLAVSRLNSGSTSEALRGFQGAGRMDPDLGPIARRNMGVALLRVLRWATASVVFLAVSLIAVQGAHDDGHPTVVPRIFAGVISLALAAVVVWVLRSMPRATLRGVMRERKMLAIRLVFLVIAVIIGLIGAALGATVVVQMVGPMLLLAVVVLTVFGWLDGN